ncbi:BLUE COPPER PROTEIN [Salix koriyanagi]|uniref:BLUE COPPER PROTEIN n=1 Tax=Salix koriyanagi TaxID=2511006 RepID=A0A9Q0YTY2_9ROSI|nr:BLUE COPPER PROTEIN [Salix koriyanagi]
MANLRTSMLVVSLLMMALCGVSMAAVYQVGDSAGWTSMGQVDYHDWAATKNFHVGDTLVFNYNNQFHNVKQVAHPGFESCNATSPIATYTNGSDTVALEKLGHFYFICGYPGHCQAGQKIDILNPFCIYIENFLQRRGLIFVFFKSFTGANSLRTADLKPAAVSS